eukprot:scaffold291119_cov29-Prasinocladus_malaysianus.AAC.1
MYDVRHCFYSLDTKINLEAIPRGNNEAQYYPYLIAGFAYVVQSNEAQQLETSEITDKSTESEPSLSSSQVKLFYASGWS